MGASKFNAGVNPGMDQHPIQEGGGWGGVEILLTIMPDGPLGLYPAFYSAIYLNRWAYSSDLHRHTLHLSNGYWIADSHGNW